MTPVRNTRICSVVSVGDGQLEEPWLAEPWLPDPAVTMQAEAGTTLVPAIVGDAQASAVLPDSLAFRADPPLTTPKSRCASCWLRTMNGLASL